MFPRSIFPVPWASLTVSGLREFFREAGDESLLWEAKGTELRPEHVLRSVCGFANSDEGGYLIVGASRPAPGEAWTLDGVPHVGELALWIDQVLRTNGLRPVPRFEVKSAWQVDMGRWATVVRVEPISVPPCMTRDGLVYLRTSADTVKVSDPRVLQELTNRGRAALEAARGHAERAAGRAAENWDDGLPPHGRQSRFAIGYAATGYADGVEQRIFTKRFQQDLWEISLAHLCPRDHPEPSVSARP